MLFLKDYPGPRGLLPIVLVDFVHAYFFITCSFIAFCGNIQAPGRLFSKMEFFERFGKMLKLAEKESYNG